MRKACEEQDSERHLIACSYVDMHIYQLKQAFTCIFWVNWDVMALQEVYTAYLGWRHFATH